MERLDEWNPLAFYFKMRKLQGEIALINRFLDEPTRFVASDSVPGAIKMPGIRREMTVG